MLHQAKSWKTSSTKYKKDLAKAEAKVIKLEEQFAEQKKRWEEAQVKIVELKNDMEKVIDNYMGSKGFKKLMVLHDSGVYPDYFEHGRDDAIKVIPEAHPGMINAEDFPCPKAVLPAGTYEDDEAEDENYIIDPENSLKNSA